MPGNEPASDRVTNPTEKAPLALYERVRRAMKDHAPEHGAHCECPCCDITSALENYADEIAALERLVESGYAAYADLDKRFVAKCDEVVRLTEYAQAQAGPTPTAADLVEAWRRYVELFHEPPHGTEKQMDALLTLLDKKSLLSRATEEARDA